MNNPVANKILALGDDEIYITVGDSRDGYDHSVDSNQGRSSNSNDNVDQQLTMGPSQSTDEPAVLHL